MAKSYRNTLYILTAVWPNTRDNHAGMYHLARSIRERAPWKVRIVKIPTRWLYVMFWVYRLYIIVIALGLRLRVRKNDTVWLMEYLLRTVQQSDAAAILKGHCNVIGTAHLVGKRLDKHYSRSSMLRRIGNLDRLYVLGNSLRDYFLQRGANPELVHTTFHYVDDDYYTPGAPTSDTGRLRAIAMGNMERDFDTLYEIVRLSPEIDFTICLGMNKTDRFDSFPNVRTVGFVPEEELRSLMQEADVSLNTMYDTIGSNVITTSLACGLPVVASRVGSIADYVTEGKEGIFFDTALEGADALARLDRDRPLVREMSASARRKAQSMSISNFINALGRDLSDMTTNRNS